MVRGGVGGGDLGGETLHADLTGASFNVEWDFDAEELFVAMITDNYNTFQIYLVDVATKNAWQAWNGSGGTWKSIGAAFSTWTINSKSVSGATSGSINVLDIIPLKTRLAYYFT